MFLIDTNVFLWALAEPQRLSVNVRTILSKNESPVLVSLASLWELSIKQQHNKLLSTADFVTEVDKAGFSVLDIKPSHLNFIKNIPLHHDDPFDHLLIAQAKVEDLTLISDNSQLQAYEVGFLLA
jgi:PIN domain nuclease of toxin-antitoxin system